MRALASLTMTSSSGLVGVCDECRNELPLYYADTTNLHYVCRACWVEMLDGARLPRPHHERMQQHALAVPASTALAVPGLDEANTAADLYKADHENVERSICAIPIDSAERAQWAANAAHMIKARLDACTTERDDYAKPLRALARRHSTKWNGAIHPLERTLKYLRDSIAAFTERSRVAAMQQLAQATSQAELTMAAAILAPKADGVVEVNRWKAEVTCTPEQTRAALADLSLRVPELAAILATAIPPAYLIVDQAALDKEAREKHEAFDVPGARAVRELAVAFR